MTPSEIAEWLDQQNDPWTIQAAATIRAQAEALKIATEALEGVALSAGKHMENGTTGSGHAQSIRSARQALARIKEVGE